jgi:type IV pilus assembly protein PilB
MDLLKVLVQKGKLTQKQVKEINEKVIETGQQAEELIIADKLIPESDLFQIKSEVLDLPLIAEVPKSISSEILSLIPRDSAEHYNLIPIGRKDDLVEIGMVYPHDIQAREALKFLSRRSGFEYSLFLISPSVFRGILDKYQTAEREVKEALESLEGELERERGELSLKGDVSEAERTMEQAPVIKMVAVILREAVEGKASDVHIEPMQDRLRVRFRLDGMLHSSLFLPLKVHAAVISRLKILSHLKIDETRVPQDGRFSTRFQNRRIDFRISTLPTTQGEKAAIRVLDPEQGFAEIGKLGALPEQEAILKEAIKMPFGMILATGPTGSGKTTTLYSLLRLLNREEANVVTLEDPVEYFIEGVNQSQIRPEINYSFIRGLRQLVRQDPDVIMVGEIRDDETASLAIHAALTGHIILSTLHTNNAVGVIPRLIDMGVDPFLVGPTLRLAIAQRLVRRLCPHCKKKVVATDSQRELIQKNYQSLPAHLQKKYTLPDPLYIYQPVGCESCNFSGYKGRLGVFEVLKMTERLADVLLKSASEEKVSEEAKQQQMITMRQSGLIRVVEGITSIEEVIRTTTES